MADTKPVIAILGASGQQGAGLAARLARAGYEVVIGSRDATRAEEAAKKLAAESGGQLRGATNMDAANAGNIVILAVPYAGQLATAKEIAPAVEGKILVDVTVPLKPPKVARVQLPEGGSAVAIVQQELGEGVRVVSAFQNVSAHQLADLDDEVDCDVLVTGDDVAAREEVCGLIRAIGMRGIHAGPLANSAAAEALTSLLISINKRYKVKNGAGIRITGLPDDPAGA